MSDTASVRDDKVPKETVLFPRERAQRVLMQELNRTKCVNTKLLPHKGGLTMFTTSQDVPNPFSTKVLEAVTKALEEDKPSPCFKGGEVHLPQYFHHSNPPSTVYE